MSLLDRITSELKESLKSGDQARLSVVRLLKSTIKNREIEKMAPLTDDEITDVIMSSVKQRRESIEQFQKGGREDLVKKEAHEIEILQTFLPPPLGEEELASVIIAVIKETGASSPKEMGKVIKAVMTRVKGRAEGAKVSSMVKELMEARVH